MTVALGTHSLAALPEALPRPVIDSHTHLDTTGEHTGIPVADLLDLAAQVGVAGAVQIGCDAEDSAWAVATAAEHPRVVACVALHPNETARYPERFDVDFATISRLARDEGVVGIGETGLDYFRTTDADAQRAQQRSFAAHIALAKETGRTLVIHDRDAHDNIADMLDVEGWPDRVIFHCFSGDAAFARRCLDAGAWLSFPGTVTFKANDDLRDAARLTPADRLLVETDAPYLTPVPERGKKNASYLIAHTVRFLADLRGDDVADLCDHLTAAAEAAYDRKWIR